MLWGIKWHIVEKMMIDAPGYKYPKKNDRSKAGTGDKGGRHGKSNKEEQTMKVTNENKHEAMAFLLSKQ